MLASARAFRPVCAASPLRPVTAFHGARPRSLMGGRSQKRFRRPSRGQTFEKSRIVLRSGRKRKEMERPCGPFCLQFPALGERTASSGEDSRRASPMRRSSGTSKEVRCHRLQALAPFASLRPDCAARKWQRNPLKSPNSRPDVVGGRSLRIHKTLAVLRAIRFARSRGTVRKCGCGCLLPSLTLDRKTRLRRDPIEERRHRERQLETRDR